MHPASDITTFALNSFPAPQKLVDKRVTETLLEGLKSNNPDVVVETTTAIGAASEKGVSSEFIHPNVDIL